MESILKEWKQYLSEFYYHDPETGHFTEKKPGVVKSLTKAGAKSRGIDTKYAERGVVTSKDKVQSKFGMNTSKDKSCGRKTISGQDITPKYSCSDYKEVYEDRFSIDELEELLLLDEADGQQDVCNQCIQSFLARIRNANAALKAARDGKTKNA